MAKDPAFLFYSSDFLTGTMFMTDEEVGIYIRLLCAQHQHGGMIPKAPFFSLVKNHQQVIIKFIECDEGFYQNRLMLEMIKRSKKSKSLSENALIRWNKTKQLECKSNAIALDLQMPIENENENVICIKELKKENTKSIIHNADFETFWTAYPKKAGKGAAERAWLKHKPDIQTVLKALQWQRASDQWKDHSGRFIPHPATWINAKKWLDEPIAKPQQRKQEFFG